MTVERRLVGYITVQSPCMKVIGPVSVEAQSVLLAGSFMGLGVGLVKREPEI